MLPLLEAAQQLRLRGSLSSLLVFEIPCLRAPTVRAVYLVVVASLCIPKAALPKDGLLCRTVEIRAGAITNTTVVIADTLCIWIIPVPSVRRPCCQEQRGDAG